MGHILKHTILTKWSVHKSLHAFAKSQELEYDLAERVASQGDPKLFKPRWVGSLDGCYMLFHVIVGTPLVYLKESRDLEQNLILCGNIYSSQGVRKCGK